MWVKSKSKRLWGCEASFESYCRIFTLYSYFRDYACLWKIIQLLPSKVAAVSTTMVKCHHVMVFVWHWYEYPCSFAPPFTRPQFAPKPYLGLKVALYAAIDLIRASIRRFSSSGLQNPAAISCKISPLLSDPHCVML